MRPKPFLPFILLLLVFAVLFTSVESAPQGTITTYLPFTLRGNGYTLPSGNLLLFEADNSTNSDLGNLFLGTPTLPSTTFQLTNHSLSPYNDFTRLQFAPNGSAIVYQKGDTIWLQGATGIPSIPIFTHAPTDILATPEWSPDSQTIAFAISDSANVHTLYFYHVADGSLTSILVSASVIRLVWSPTEPYLFYVSSITGSQTLYRANTDGTAPMAIVQGWQSIRFRSVLPDGRLLIQSLGNTADLYLVNSDGSNLTPLTSDALFEGGVASHPQGNRFIYFHNQVMYFIDAAGTIIWDYAFPCDDKEGCNPPSQIIWSPDGTEIALAYDGTIYKVAATDTPTPPTIITDDNFRVFAYSPDNRYFAYDVWDNTHIRIIDRTTQTSQDLTVPDSWLRFWGWRPLP